MQTKNHIEGIEYNFDFPIEGGRPPDPKNFWYFAWIRVSTEGVQGFTDYQVYLGTPLSLREHFKEVQDHISAFYEDPGYCVFGRGLLLVEEYNLEEIEAAICREVDRLQYYAFDIS